jgi:O-antigen ligase
MGSDVPFAVTHEGQGGLSARPVFPIVAWVAYCLAIVAPALVVDSIPFAGAGGIFAAGGRYALRVGMLGVPTAVAVLFWGIALLRSQVRLRHTPFLWGLLGLVSIAGLSTLLAIDRRVALFGFWIDEQGFLVWVLYALLVFLGSQLITSRRRLVQLTLCVVGTGAVVAAIALLEVGGVRLFGIPAEEWAYARGVSTMMNPDFLGTFLVAPAVLGVAFAISQRGWLRIVAAIGAAITLMSLVYTLTRGAWAAAAVGLVALAVWGMWTRRDSRATRKAVEAESDSSGRRGIPSLVAWAGAGVVGAVAAARLGTGTLSSRITETLTGASGLDILLSGRLTLWSELLQAVRARPLLGAGPGNMVYAWQRFAGEGSLQMIGSGAVVDSAHNVPLDLAVQFGVPFAVLAGVGVAWLAVRALTAAARVARKGATGGGWLEVGWIVAAVALGIAFTTGVTVVPIMTLVAAVIGVLLAFDARPGTAKPPAVRVSVSAVLTVVALGLGAWAAFTGASAIAGNQATPSLTERATRDLKALELAPWRIYPASDLVTVTQALGTVEQSMVGVSAARTHDMLLERDGMNAITLYGAGDYHLTQEQDAARALQFAERSLELRPMFVPGIMLKGDAFAAQGRLEDAVVYLERAVALESTVTILHAWEAPWISYLSVLIGQARQDPLAAAHARDVYAEFSARFPGSMMRGVIERELATLDG